MVLILISSWFLLSSQEDEQYAKFKEYMTHMELYNNFKRQGGPRHLMLAAAQAASQAAKELQQMASSSDLTSILGSGFLDR